MAIQQSSSAEKRGPSMLEVLRIRNFRLLWIGEGISLLGDQFYMIALPWLVLQLTGNALAVGTVLAAAGIPRALFMLLGGALTDRFSQRALMLGSNLFRLALVSLLSVLVLTGLIQVWMIYVMALLFGLADAFFFPAQSSMVPTLVQGEHLQAGNAIIQGTATLSQFLGPVLAGIMIAVLSAGQNGGITPSTPNMEGIAVAFAIDALSFVASVITLAAMTTPRSEAQATAGRGEGILASIREGMANVWNDAPMRLIFVIVAAINLLVNGPFAVGVPVLARHFPEGAAAFGIIVSAFGGGALFGILLAGILPKPSPEHTMGHVLIVLTVMGIGLAMLGLASSTAVAALIALMMGTTNGYVNILAITWLQNRTPEAMLGRMMSLVMFASLGLNPVSTALAGALIGLNATALFVAAGSLMTAIVLLTSLNPAVRVIEAKQA